MDASHHAMMPANGGGPGAIEAMQTAGDMGIRKLGKARNISAMKHEPGRKICLNSKISDRFCDGRGERIRTSGPCLPKTVLYQAELLPDGVRNPFVPVGQAGPASQVAAL